MISFFGDLGATQFRCTGSVVPIQFTRRCGSFHLTLLCHKLLVFNQILKDSLCIVTYLGLFVIFVSGSLVTHGVVFVVTP